MKQTILLVGHGSRAEEGNRELVDWAMRWAKEHPEWEIVTCYIEFAEVLLEEGLDQAAAKGGSVPRATLKWKSPRPLKPPACGIRR